MSPRLLLRLEGLCVLLAAAALYVQLGHSGWLFAGALLAPDLVLMGYLAGPRLGALAYNAGHTYIAPLGLGVVGFVLAEPLGVALALIWGAHIGMDRALGYGLKRPTGFHDTHLTPSEDRSPAPPPRNIVSPRAPLADA